MRTDEETTHKGTWSAANVGGLIALIGAIIASIGIAIMTGGCVYKGGKITEGVDFSAGVSIPGTEGAAEISFVNYLSGFRFGIDRNCGMECEYYGTNTFSFAWGLYESASAKHFTATVSPCEVAATNGVLQSAREPETARDTPPPDGEAQEAK